MDANSLKSALLDVLSNKEEALSRAQQAQEFAQEKFSHELELEQIEKLILGD
jgi:hypothetical protein